MMDKAVLLKPRLTEEVVEIPGLGEVRVRALSRAEVMDLQEGRERRGQLGTEAWCLAVGLVDPVLTEEEATELLQASPGAELQPVVDAVFRLSGLSEVAPDSQKSL